MAKVAAPSAIAVSAPAPVQSAAQSTIDSLVDDFLGGGSAGDNQVDTETVAANDPTSESTISSKMRLPLGEIFMRLLKMEG